jgi:hypothetical protein
VREDHKFRIDTREMIFKEQEGICVYCKKPIKGKPSMDHIIPVFIGGNLYDKDNLVCCCVRCNKAKGDHIVFSSLEDKEIYPMIQEIPYFFRASYIQTNKFKENK